MNFIKCFPLLLCSFTGSHRPWSSCSNSCVQRGHRPSLLSRCMCIDKETTFAIEVLRERWQFSCTHFWKKVSGQVNMVRYRALFVGKIRKLTITLIHVAIIMVKYTEIWNLWIIFILHTLIISLVLTISHFDLHSDSWG